MELKYGLGVQRKIFESTFISNLNQVIPDDITWDMTVFVRHVQAVSEYPISTDIPNIARYSHLPRSRRVPEVIHGCSLRFPSVSKSFGPTVIKIFKFQWGVSNLPTRSKCYKFVQVTIQPTYSLSHFRPLHSRSLRIRLGCVDWKTFSEVHNRGSNTCCTLFPSPWFCPTGFSW